MAAILVLLLLAAVELWTIVAVAGQVGVVVTLGLLLGAAVLGVWLVKRQGLAAWRRATAELAAGRAPTRSLLDGALVLIGGCLLVLPGFVSDVVGLLVLVPPVRAALRPVLLRRLQRRAARSDGFHAVVIDTVGSSWDATRGHRSPWGTVIGGSVVDVEGAEAAPHAEVVDVEFDAPPQLPRPERPAS